METEKQPDRMLVKKLAEVMGVVKRIPKRGRNDFHKYDYAMESDIVDSIRSELAKRHVMLLPGVVKQTRTSYERKSQNGAKTVMLTDVEMTFTFIDGETGETLERRWEGCGEDSSDKGLYKAITGSDKYFLMKTFLMSTGDDPEADTKKRHTAPKNSIGKPELKKLGAVVVAARISNEMALAIARRVCGAPDMESAVQIPSDKFEAVCKAIEAGTAGPPEDAA